MIVSPSTVYGWLQGLSEEFHSGLSRGIIEVLERSPCAVVEVPCRLRAGDDVAEWLEQVRVTGACKQSPD